jgi:hypothetical protein
VVVVQTLVVERREGTVVMTVGALHVLVAFEEVGERVRTADAAERGLPHRLAADHDLLRAGTLGDRGDVGRNVDDEPVREVDAVCVLRDRLAVLVDVGGIGGHVGIEDDDRKGLGAFGMTRPAQMRTAVAAFGGGFAVAVGNAERVRVRNALTVVDAVARNRQGHCLVSSS